MTAIITDNAANMLRAFVTLPGKYQEMLDNADSDDDDDDLEETYHMSELTPGELGTHISCFLHTLQLVVKDGLEKLRGGVSTTIIKVCWIRTEVIGSQ